MSVTYQSTALIVEPPERIAELAATSLDVKWREVLFLKESHLVMTETGNYGESLTADVLEWAEKDPELEAIVSWDNEGGVGASYGVRGGAIVFEEYDNDIFTSKEASTTPVTSDAAWFQLMVGSLCRLVPSSTPLANYLPYNLRPTEETK